MTDEELKNLLLPHQSNSVVKSCLNDIDGGQLLSHNSGSIAQAEWARTLRIRSGIWKSKNVPMSGVDEALAALRSDETSRVYMVAVVSNPHGFSFLFDDHQKLLAAISFGRRV